MVNYRIALFIAFLFRIAFTFAQGGGAHLLVIKADSLLGLEEFALAQENYKEALGFFEEENDWLNYYNTQINYAKSIGSREEDATLTATHLTEVIKQHQAALPADSILVVLHKKLGIHFFLQNNFKDAAHWFSLTLEVARKVFPLDHYYINNSIKNAANSYQMNGDYQDAIEKWELQLTLFENHDTIDSSYLAIIYTLIAANYRGLGDFLISKNYYEQALKIYQKEEAPDLAQMAELHTYLGILFLELEQYRKAQVNFQTALNLFQKPEVNDIEGIANSYNNFGLVYLGKEVELDSALTAFEKSLDIYKKIGDESKMAKAYSNLGITSKLLNKYPNSTRYLLKAKDKSERTYGKLSPHTSIIFQNLAEVEGLQQQNEAALGYYQKAIACHLPDFRPDDLYSNPKLEEMGVLGDPAELLDQLNLKGNLLLKMATKETDTRILHKKALETYVAADQLIDKMRQNQEAKGSKLIWLETTHRIYEEAITLALKLEGQTKEKQYMDQAFYFIEKSKSILLLESHLNDKAKKFAGLPLELQEKETQNKQQLHEAEQALFEQKQLGKTGKGFETLKQKVFSLKQAAIAINKELEQKHPRYYRMKYQTEPTSLTKIQARLEADQAMLQYFVGDEKLILMVISADSIAYHTTPDTQELPILIAAFRSHIIDHFLMPGKADYMTSAQNYSNLAYQLYEKLLPKTKLPKKLIIVQDGVLGYLPFDALLTSQAENPTKFKSHPYLMLQHQISYLYSATLLEEMRQKPAATKGLLAFAPSFGDEEIAQGNRDDLGPLFFNQEEVKRIAKIAGGKQFLGKKATESVFYELGSSYQILHFATHGKANDEEPDFSYLAFAATKDSLENEFLYVNDLYNMQLSAELAVLSACETGIGRLYHGEGVASLARGFAYAGVPSIITTLWSVNDAKAAEIMTDFYLNMKAGKEKDAALREARLKYLERNDHNQAHPFYWAAPIAIGNMSPMEIKGTGTGIRLWYLLGVAGIALVLWGIKKRISA